MAHSWFQSKNVALLQSLLTGATVVISWLIALHQGHVQLWPIPMISYCGVHPPEKYVFSIGLVCAASLMFLFIWIVETADKVYSSSTVAWLLGFPCSVGLMVLAVCNCEDTPYLHYTGAISYFLCSMLYSLCCSFKELKLSVEKRSNWVYVRQIIAVLITFFSLGLGFCYLIGVKSDQWPVPVNEWSAVLMMELYVMTFYFDLGDHYFIEQVKEVFGRKQPGNGIIYNDDEEPLMFDDLSHSV